MTHVPYTGFLGLLGISFYMMMTFNESRQDSKPNDVCIPGPGIHAYLRILWICVSGFFLACVGVAD